MAGTRSDSGKPDASNWGWADRGTPHVAFSKDEPLPFQEGDVLGHGVNRPVTQTVIKGVRVALKKIYCRQGVGQKSLQEIEIIRKLKHPHIIQLAGSYTRGPYLGILLYPLARCDLTTFLEDIDFLQRVERVLSYSLGLAHSDFEQFEERISRCATISRIEMRQQNRVTILSDVIKAARVRIWESYGCITNAMLYLHGNSIRHKDIKPLNILLSRDGLWITDFGQSTDFSEFSDSATSGGERGTIKYCAPEVATFERSGRSADVFSLGCIFFEMAGLRCFTLEDMTGFRPSMDRSFHNNLDSIFPVFQTYGSTALDHLPMSLVKRMLSRNPADRPNLASISRTLSLFQAFSTVEPDTIPIIRCPHHKLLQVSDYQLGVPAVKELLVTIGNTSNEATEEFVIIKGEKRWRFPIVVFVECSPVEYINIVIFFQHSSSSHLSVNILGPPFAMRSAIWGTYTQAVLVILKPGYYWGSELASLVPWDAPGSYQSALHLAWELQVDVPYDSKTIHVPVSRGHPF